MSEKRPEEYLDEFEKEKLDDAKLKDAKSKAGHLGSLKEQFLLLVQMAKDVIQGKFKLSGVETAVLIGAIIYVISPIDAIPDVLPVIGWADDIGVVGLALKKLDDALTRYKNFMS